MMRPSTINRLALQYERAATTFQHLAAMARDARIVVESRRVELRKAEAVLAIKNSKKARLRQRSFRYAI